jgi:hypothetical protein
MDSKDKLIADTLDLLNDIGFNVLQHEHTCYDEDDEGDDYKCYCGVEEILGKIAILNKRSRLLSANSKINI